MTEVGSVTVKALLDDSQIRRQEELLRRKLGSIPDADVKVKIDTNDFQQKLGSGYGTQDIRTSVAAH